MPNQAQIPGESGQMPKPLTPAVGVETNLKPPQVPKIGGGMQPLQQPPASAQMPMPGTQPIDTAGGLKVASQSPTNPGNWMSQPPSWYNQAPSWYKGNDNTNSLTKPGPAGYPPPVSAKPPATPPQTFSNPRVPPVPNMPTNPVAATGAQGQNPVVGGRSAGLPPAGGSSIRDAIAARNGQLPPGRGLNTPTTGTDAANRLGQSGGSIKDYIAARNAQPMGSISDSTLARGYSTPGQPDNAPQNFGNGRQPRGRQNDPTMRNDRYQSKGAPSTPLQRAMEQSGQGQPQAQYLQPRSKLSPRNKMTPPQQVEAKVGAKGTKGGRTSNAKAGSGKGRGGTGIKK